MLPRIHIRDGNFFNRQHPKRSGTFFSWVWDELPQTSDITVFTDLFMHEVCDSKSAIKIGWLLEPEAVDPKPYALADSLIDKFNCVFTFDQKRCAAHAKYKFYTFGGCWVHPPDWAIYPKKRLVSMIASNKAFTPGQKFRIATMEKVKDSVDVMGRGCRPIANKVEGLADYMFSIAMENCRIPYYFSEKLVDCFACGTVPIYWGCPDIGRFFDPAGIITFDDLTSLEKIIGNLREETYQSMEEAIRNNFKIAKILQSPEDSIWHAGLNEIIWAQKKQSSSG